MKQFTSVKDVLDPENLIQKALQIKADKRAEYKKGVGKTLGLIFMNPSLRTRLSTQIAARNLGMDVMVMNIDKEGWALEFEEGAIMNGSTVEHIKDAAAVMGSYCNIIGLRSFPSLTDKEKDDSEYLFNQFIRYAGVPVLSLESATRHPLQSFADLLTIRENFKENRKPRIALTWAPHIKALPQAVANSFSEWMLASGADLHIAHPEGLDLNPEFTRGARITTNQEEALENADFVYVKNWSSWNEYGKPFLDGGSWMLTPEKLKNSNQAKIMHCLPVRRNVELSDQLLDSEFSLVQQQAENRIYAAQTVLSKML